MKKKKKISSNACKTIDVDPIVFHKNRSTNKISFQSFCLVYSILYWRKNV